MNRIVIYNKKYKVTKKIRFSLNHKQDFATCIANYVSGIEEDGVEWEKADILG